MGQKTMNTKTKQKTDRKQTRQLTIELPLPLIRALQESALALAALDRAVAAIRAMRTTNAKGKV